ncbi:MAG: diaminopimelate dehydrogenase [Bacteroidales bacterium]|nr:diaminopimelate dehydrogenase [Bacteroidales bacterium]
MESHLSEKIRVAIVGYGNIGKAAEEALRLTPDMTPVGVFHHQDPLEGMEADVALLCVPTREVPVFAERLLKQGVSTVDSFDIHGRIAGLRQSLTPVAKTHKAVGIVAAGWDPGTDSVVRALMQAMAPRGITYTDFGPGRSMGHTVAAKAIPGVKDALSMTIPLGTGIHRRMVYVELKDGADFREVERLLLEDDYFAHDETHVVQVPSVDALNNVAHGVHLSRSGVSGSTHNQRFSFDMSINNPALTAQIMVSCARAAFRMKKEGRYGAYTLIEVAPVDLLPGDAETNVRLWV